MRHAPPPEPQMQQMMQQHQLMAQELEAKTRIIETDAVKAEKAQAKANVAAAKVLASCAICGFQLHGEITTHCDHCGHDHMTTAGDKCPNPNCTGVLA